MHRTRLLQPSFKALLTGCLLGLTLAAVLPVAYFGAQLVRKNMEADAEKHLHESALLVRNTIEVYLQLHHAAVSSVSAVMTPESEFGPLDLAVASRQLQQVARNHPGFLTMLVTDRNGWIVQAVRRGEASFRPKGRENRKVDDRGYFRYPRLLRAPYLSGVFRGRGLGRDVIVAMSAPILTRKGEFAGVVEASIDITRIPLRPEAIHHSPAVVALDRENRIVYSSRPESYAPLSEWPADWNATGNATGGSMFHLRGHRLVVYPLQPYSWRVVALLPSELVESEVRLFYRSVAIALVLITGLILLAAERTARLVARPVVDLEHDMRHYRLDVEAAPSLARKFVPYEIAQIQGEFVILSRRVRDAFQQVKDALRARDATNQQLQEVLGDLDRKVTERTRQLAESESRYRHVVEHSGELIYQTDTFGRITFHNGAFEALLGVSATGRKLQEFIEPVTREEVRRQAVGQLRQRTPLLYLEFLMLAPGGRSYWIGQGTQLLLDESGRPCGFQAIARDITAKKAAEMALREAEERYTLAVRGSKSGIWDWDLRTGRTYFSERWKQMLGLPASSGAADTIDTWLDRVHPHDSAPLNAMLTDFVRRGPEQFEYESRVRHADGTWRWVLTCGAAVRGASGEATRIAGSTADVTQGKLADALTGLPNRLFVIDRLERLIARQRENPDRCFALLFMDLDRFKLVNDSLGHLKGDLLLLNVSRRLASALGQSGQGTAGRLGGDEFVVILDDAPAPEDAIRIARAIQKEMEAPMHLDGSLLFTSLSIGIAHSSNPVQSAEDALQHADTAMYHAKSEGRGLYCLYNSSMHARAVARLELEMDLRRAVAENQFVLHYQPQVDLRTGRLSGFEALVRWNHPVRGLIYPQEFIRVAEENGLILALGRWVIETGCRQLAAWTAEYPESTRNLTLSLNLSARQFADPNLVRTIAGVLAETQVKPGRLHLEITESVVAEDPAAARQILDELARMGVGLELDDFGTGYSCLGQLHTLPFDTLKIDRSFVSAMDQVAASADQDARKIVESILSLSSSLGIQVVAEGIESASHSKQLASMGCGIGQGYYFSKPVPKEKVECLLQGGGCEDWTEAPDPTGEIANLSRGLAGQNATPNLVQ